MSEQNETPILSRLRPSEGAVRGKRRKGRGPGSGLGKTAGHGQKGQKARHPGNFSKLGFEGGQMPLYRRMPYRGFTNARFRTDYTIINVDKLDVFTDGDVVDLGAEAVMAALADAGVTMGDIGVLAAGNLMGAGGITEGSCSSHSRRSASPLTMTSAC